MFDIAWCDKYDFAVFYLLYFMANWKSRHQHHGISIGINVGIDISNFYFCLSKFLMKKSSLVKSFWSTLAHLSRSFSRCLEQLFCRNLLALASEERNSTVDVISGVLKTLTAESCILHVCKFLISNPIRDHFLEIFCKF